VWLRTNATHVRRTCSEEPDEVESLKSGSEDQSGDVKLSHEHEREDVSHTTEFNKPR
jgi:hypothetical protein